MPRREKTDGLVAKYTTDLPHQEYVENLTRPKNLLRRLGDYNSTKYTHASCGADTLTVVLTGSTGSLGSYLLDSLRSDRTVDKVYCLTRDGTKERQQKAFQERGLDRIIPDKIP